MTRDRADAARNTALVLEAAREVFATRGLAAGVGEVAARAGVGKATVYRCWPTKDALVSAVAASRVEWFTCLVREALDGADPWAAFERVLLLAGESSARNRLLHAGLVHETPELVAQRQAAATALQELMDRAVAAGSMRSDARAADVTVLFNGMVAALNAAGEADPAVWRRYAGLVAAAFRA